MPENRLSSNILLIFLWLFLVTTALLCRPLMPIDETRYVSVAWEMWQSKSFLVPHLSGVPYSHKPPLFFYLIHLGWFIFGVNEWSARLTGPFFGLLNLFLAAHLARRLWPTERQISRLAPFVLLAMPLWTVMTTLTMFDLLLTFFTLLGAEGFLLAGRGKRLTGWGLVAIAIGGGLLAKGPVVLLAIVPLGLLAPWWGKDNATRSWHWYAGLLTSSLIGVTIALVWAIPAAKAGGPEYAQAILWGQTAGRVVKSFAHCRPFWWYLPIIPVVTLPWAVQLLLRPRLLAVKLDMGTRFCLSWSIPTFLLLSLVSGKQIHYLIPLLPPAALLITKLMVSDKQPLSTIPLRTMALLYIIAGIGLVVLPQVMNHTEDMSNIKNLPIFWSILFILGGIIFFLQQPKDHAATVVGSCIAMVVFISLIHLGPFHQLAPIYDLSPMAARISEQQQQGKKIAIYPAKYSNQFQFPGRLSHVLFAIDDLRELKSWLKKYPDALVVMISKKPLPSPAAEKPEFSYPFRGRQSSLWKTKTLLSVLENPNS